MQVKPTPQRPLIPCEICGTPFPQRPASKRQGPSRFCSIVCRGLGRKNGEYRPCEECGESFYASKGKTDRALCSNRCKYIQTGRRVTGDPVARLWGKVDKDGPIPEYGAKYGNCWPRRGSSVNEYSVISVNDRKLLATHYAWELASGERFPDGLWALHACDNPRCIRQDGPLGTYDVNGTLYPRYGHLWLGDHNANMADAKNKGRVSRLGGPSLLGVAHPMAKLDDAAVIAIRHDYALGAPTEMLAMHHLVTEATIMDVVKRKTWRHLN